jgi:cytoskeletal protein RodZ
VKKIGTIIGVVVVAAVVAGGGYAIGTNHTSKESTTSSSSVSTSSAVSSTTKSTSDSTSSSSSVASSATSSATSATSQKGANPQTSASYDPNKTLNGQTVDSSMIQQVTAQLKAAGLPADQWAPSDIKQIITQASQQGVSPVTYAKQNFHQ